MAICGTNEYFLAENILNLQTLWLHELVFCSLVEWPNVNANMVCIIRAQVITMVLMYGMSNKNLVIFKANQKCT